MNETLSTYTFLLGSGVSCAAKLPNVQKLSCVARAATTGTEARLLEIIKDISGATHGDGRDSYEDWFFVADQIHQHEAGDFENPALLPLMERLRCSLGMNNEEIKATAERLCVGIAATVRHELSSSKACPDDAFEGLADAIKERGGSQFHFFSLNHDLVLETWLQDQGVTAYTCLERHPESSAYKRVSFSRQSFETAPVSIIKLHGSLNWRRFRPKKNKKAPDKFRGEFLGIRHGEDSQFEQMEDDPRALIGTWNKIVQYSSPIFLPMLEQFHRSLRGSSHLIVCGYGFGDKGINSLLIDWMCSKEEPRLIVIDPQPFHPSRCRRAVFDKFGVWQRDKRLEAIPRSVGIDDMTWAEILEKNDGR